MPANGIVLSHSLRVLAARVPLGARRCNRTSRLRPRKDLQIQAFLKRLKGFEPSTFCMASRAHGSRSLRISLQTRGVLGPSLGRDSPGFTAKSRRLGTQWAPRRLASGCPGLLGGDVPVRPARVQTRSYSVSRTSTSPAKPIGEAAEFAGERVAHDPIVGTATTWSARRDTSTPLTSPRAVRSSVAQARSPFSIGSSTVKR
jgi:hypothetical protein